MKDIADYLPHLRTIHFALVLTSSIVLYLAASSWGDKPTILAELAWLERLVERSERGLLPIGELDLAELNRPWHDQHLARILRGLTKDSPDIELEASAVGSTFLHVASNLDTKPLSADPVYSSLARIKAWGDEFRVGVRVMDTPILEDEMRERIVKLADYNKNVVVKQLEVDWAANPVTAEVTFLYWAMAGNGETTMVPTALAIPFETTFVEVGLDEAWFQRFSRLRDHWSELSALSIDHARDLTNAALGEDLSAVMERQTILGMSIRGEDIGVLGPTAIFGLVIYLLLYTRQTRTTLYTHGPGDIWAPNWIAVMDSGLAGTASFVTIVLLPNLAVALAIYRFVYSRISAFLLLAVLLPLTYWTFLLARDTGQRLARLPAQDE